MTGCPISQGFLRRISILYPFVKNWIQQLRHCTALPVSIGGAFDWKEFLDGAARTCEAWRLPLVVWNLTPTLMHSVLHLMRLRFTSSPHLLLSGRARGRKKHFALKFHLKRLHINWLTVRSFLFSLEPVWCKTFLGKLAAAYFSCLKIKLLCQITLLLLVW